jgi:hypothetical protein
MLLLVGALAPLVAAALGGHPPGTLQPQWTDAAALYGEQALTPTPREHRHGGRPPHALNSGTHMAWIAGKKVGVCACAKCGTTALFRGIYQGVFHRQYDPRSFKGDIQRIHAPQWHGLFAKEGGPPDFFVSGVNGSERGAHDGYAIAFVREPVSRLISAWKDKFSCGLWVPKEGDAGVKHGDGGWFEASDGATRRRSNIRELTALVGHGGSGETKLSRHCPRDGHGLARHGQTSPSENTTFDGTCTYTNCLSLETFADYLLIVHEKGLQDELNEHIRPQSRDCFRNGATPDKWDKVTTGYDKPAIKKLGQLLGAEISLDDEGDATKAGMLHSTADALYDGRQIHVPSSVMHKLKLVTREEEQMLSKYYASPPPAAAPAPLHHEHKTSPSTHEHSSASTHEHKASSSHEHKAPSSHEHTAPTHHVNKTSSSHEHKTPPSHEDQPPTPAEEPKAPSTLEQEAQPAPPP